MFKAWLALMVYYIVSCKFSWREPMFYIGFVGFIIAVIYYSQELVKEIFRIDDQLF